MKNSLWMDLELRKDIDDYATLIHAIENKSNIKYLSCHNPSVNELKLFNYTMEIYRLNIPLIISGEVTEYPDDEDIHISLLEHFEMYPTVRFIHIDQLDKNYLDQFNKENPLTVFCGGSLTTLSILLDKFDNEKINAVIQGGYASYEIVEEQHVLKKFKKRKSVPTWNLNLDLEATKKVLKTNIKAKFISKNICHDSWVDIDELNTKQTAFKSIMTQYFKHSTYKDNKKCLHDLLAFFAIEHDIIEFKKVDFHFSDDERAKCHTTLNDNSNFSISVAFSKDEFKKIIKRI